MFSEKLKYTNVVIIYRSRFLAGDVNKCEIWKVRFPTTVKIT